MVSIHSVCYFKVHIYLLQKLQLKIHYNRQVYFFIKLVVCSKWRISVMDENFSPCSMKLSLHHYNLESLGYRRDHLLCSTEFSFAPFFLKDNFISFLLEIGVFSISKYSQRFSIGLKSSDCRGVIGRSSVNLAIRFGSLFVRKSMPHPVAVFFEYFPASCL